MHNSVMFQMNDEGRFFSENPLVTRDRAGALALLTELRQVAAEHDDASLSKTWTYAALGMMHEAASDDPIAALGLLRDVLSLTAAKWDGDLLNLWHPYVGNIVNAAMGDWLAAMRGKVNTNYDAGTREQWAKAALILMNELWSFSPAPIAAGVLLAEMRAVAAAQDEAILWEAWGMAAIMFMARPPSRDLDAARALLDDMRRVAEERDDAVLWECWGRASHNLIVGLGSRDPSVSRALVHDMLGTVETHPGEVGGWQTKLVGLVLHAAFTLTEDLASRDPKAARAFCAETLGLPQELLAVMQFGDDATG
jgi:hypothetical protein